MNPVKSIAMLLAGASFVAPACAQEPPRPNLLLQMTPPASSVSIDSTRRGDDIQDRQDGLGMERFGTGTRRRPR